MNMEVTPCILNRTSSFTIINFHVVLIKPQPHEMQLTLVKNFKTYLKNFTPLGELIS